MTSPALVFPAFPAPAPAQAPGQAVPPQAVAGGGVAFAGMLAGLVASAPQAGPAAPLAAAAPASTAQPPSSPAAAANSLAVGKAQPKVRLGHRGKAAGSDPIPPPTGPAPVVAGPAAALPAALPLPTLVAAAPGVAAHAEGAGAGAPRDAAAPQPAPGQADSPAMPMVAAAVPRASEPPVPASLDPIGSIGAPGPAPSILPQHAGPQDLAPAASSAAKPAASGPAAAASQPDGLARQLAPALVQLTHGPTGNTVTLRLDPVGLGHVQVRIDRDAAGTPTIQVSAEHPDTLRLLVADQPQLHRALDSAGVASDGRTLSFSLDTPGGTATGSGSTGTGSSGGEPFGGSTDGGAPGQQGGHRGTRTAFVAASDDDTAFPPFPAWLRAGVDITA